MKSVKAHLALILPLFAILFGIEYLIVFDRIVKDYEMKLNNEYSLIVVADKTVKPEEIARASALIKSVEPLNAEKILHHIRKDMSIKNIDKIKSVMPIFYRIKLSNYPDKKGLERLKLDLMGIAGIKSVHTFEKTHDPLYEMLTFTKSNLTIFSLLLALVSLLLIVKQMYVWQLEHRERMQIMALFGAPVWLRSGVLFRLAIVDTFIAISLIVAGDYYLLEHSGLLSFLHEINIDPASIFSYDDMAVLAIIGFGISIFSALVVVVRFKEEP